MHHRTYLSVAAFAAILAGCSGSPSDAPRVAASPAMLDSISEPYVKLVLAVGKHDPDYVDAYYGPPEWKAASDSDTLALPEIASRAAALIARLDSIPQYSDSLLKLRHSYLRTQLGALATRVSMLEGKKLSFDEESKALYDAVAPAHPRVSDQRRRHTAAVRTRHGPAGA